MCRLLAGTCGHLKFHHQLTSNWCIQHMSETFILIFIETQHYALCILYTIGRKCFFTLFISTWVQADPWIFIKVCESIGRILMITEIFLSIKFHDEKVSKGGKFLQIKPFSRKLGELVSQNIKFTFESLYRPDGFFWAQNVKLLMKNEGSCRNSSASCASQAPGIYLFCLHADMNPNLDSRKGTGFEKMYIN